MRMLAAPVLGQSTPRIVGVETTTYRLAATLVSMKTEDDRDIHLVIADPADSALTMVAELPDVACEGAADSIRRDQIQAARAALVAASGNAPVSSFKQLHGAAIITGVGFFGFLHGQTGIAPNGIELHPVLPLKAGAGPPDRHQYAQPSVPCASAERPAASASAPPARGSTTRKDPRRAAH